MRHDEEKTPILAGGNKVKMSTFDTSDKTSLNSVVDDFDYPSDPKKTLEGTLDPNVIGLSVGFLLLSTGAMVGLPLYLAGLVTHKSDPFALCFLLPTTGTLLTLVVTLIMRRVMRGTYREISLYPFFLKPIAIYGLLTSFGLILQGFCGVPSRTPAYIQATTVIITIPAALITKYAMYQKAYTCRQIVCILAVMAATVLVMLNLLATPTYVPGAAPNTHNLPASFSQSLQLMAVPDTDVNSTVTSTSSSTTTTVLITKSIDNSSELNGNMSSSPGPVVDVSTTTLSTTTESNPLEEQPTVLARTLWSVGFAMGYVFHGVAIVLLDEPIRLKGGHPMVVCLYGHTMTFLWMVFWFFFDLIPVFGWATYLADFRGHLHHSIKCLVGADTDCAVLAWRGWLDIVLYTGFSMAQCYLMRIAQCPLYVVLVTASAVPFSALFWLCVADPGITLLWAPSLTPMAAIVFIAMWITVPAAYMYRYFCRKEQKETFDQL